MNNVCLELPGGTYRDLWKHLVPRRQGNEEAAFCYARPLQGQSGTYEVIGCRRILPGEFAFQSDYHIELRDDVRAEIIKRAHDLDASIVEFHSHVFGGPPEFSWSDVSGFRETVPHCLWRLKGKPYFAVVVSKGGFDGLAWFAKEEGARQLEWIRSGAVRLEASCKTINNL
jgi:hypothetical protein